MILKLENVSIAFGPKRVLEDISFEVEPGEAVGLMGPNGAGKTTVLRCVLGLLQYRGRIWVDGLDAREVAARRRIGYVPQTPAFYDMTAREAIRFVARLRGVSADGALGRVHLEGDEDRPVKVFSGGMKQRLSLAASLLGDPPLILLDEPTANLDPKGRQDLLRMLVDLKRQGKTLVLSSHRAREVNGLVDRVIELCDGRIASNGKPEDRELVALSVAAHGGERESIAALLSEFHARPVPSMNGSFDALIAAQQIVPVIERLRGAGVASERISVRPTEGGAA